MIKQMASCAIVLLGLAACESGSGNAAFNDAKSDQEVFSAAVKSEAVTPAADMPTKGGAIFRGFAKIDYADPVVADMALTVDFASSDVSGRLDNFQDGAGTDYPSGIDLQGQVNGNGLTATGIGAPTTRNGIRGSIPDAIVVDIDGTFRGDNAYNAAGSLSVSDAGSDVSTPGTFAVSQYPGFALPGFPPPGQN